MIESRPIPGPALLEHHDRVIGCLMGAGFEPVVASQAFAVVDAFIYGFVLSETTMPFDMREGAEMEYAAEIAPDAGKISSPGSEPGSTAGHRELCIF